MTATALAVPAIELVGVDKHFGDVHALARVSLTVAPGEVVGLLGPNGAGKTTLVRAVATLLEPDGGTVRVNGLDVSRAAAAVRRRIGLAGQLAALDELLTGRENLELVGRLYGLRSATAAERAGDLLERFGLAHAGDRRVATYSGGMRRRLDLGATLIGDPDVLLLDEPTAGLDPKSRNDLWEMVDRVAAEGTTVLLTSQYLEELDRLASRIVVIDEGRIIADGEASELKRRVGRHVIEARLDDADQLDTVSAILSTTTGATAQEDLVLRQVTAPSDGTMADLVGAATRLDAAGIVPVELGFRLPSLDDVFFALTGAPAISAPAPAQPDEGMTAPTAPPPARRAGEPSGRHGLADVAAMTRRECVRMLRMPQLLFFATVQPVLFVVGLSVVFGPLVESMLHQGYIEYLLPGVLVMNLILASGSTGIRLAEDMKAGIIDRFRSLPMSRVAVLAARTLGDLIRNTAAALCIVVSGYAVGYRLPGPVLGGLAAIALSLFFAYATTWLFASIGLAVKDPQTAQFAGFAPVLPLVFLSGAWVPVATMSHSIQGFARHQPVNVTIDAVRSLAGGSVDSSAVVQSLLWSVGLIVVFGALSVRQYQRAS